VDEVIETLYSQKFFSSTERAAEWKDRIEQIFETTIEVQPEDRVNPDYRD
jgi:hypothetical protein